MSGRKRSLPIVEEGDGGEGVSPRKKRTAKEVKPLDPKKFGGKTEEEVCQMLLPDHLASGLDIIFVSHKKRSSKIRFLGDSSLSSIILFLDGNQPWTVLSVFGPSLLQCQQPLL